MNTKRLERVIGKMKEKGVPQLVLTNPHSINYLAGHFEEPLERFWAMYIHESGKCCLIANRLFTLDEVTGIPINWYEDGEDGCAVLAAQTDHGQMLGVDGVMKARFLLDLMKMGAGTSFETASDCVDEVRYQKDEEELELMREASRINDRAMGEFKKLIRAGVTEKQIADQMHGIYISLGAEDYSFQPIVAFGANAAVGHHLPDDTVLKEGDCVLFDVGCKYRGYCSDMTRTFFYGSVDEESRKVYETVLQAQVSAEEAVRTGMILCELDTLARNVISDAGYGPYFTHRLGHFIGTETHEKGDVSQSSRIVSAPGMTFSIEPGIYVPGKVGVRIEDLVIVTENGAELLNHYPKELQVIPAE